MKKIPIPSSLLLPLGMILGITGMVACSTDPLVSNNDLRPDRQAFYTPLADTEGLKKAIRRKADRRVILTGEIHDRYEHHLAQLAVVRELHDMGVKFAVGLEFIQRPYQSHLDAYILGDITEKAMLKRTEYVPRWGFDYRLYRPVVEFAQRNGIPLVALNAPTELVREVSANGMQGLAPQWQAMLPEEMLRPDRAYRQRLMNAISVHKAGAVSELDRFVEVQWLWDEYMADSAVDYLAANPDHSMVIIAGSGHMRYGFGIPERIQKRLGMEPVIVLSGGPGEVDEAAADIVIVSQRKDLPRPGRLAWAMREDDLGVLLSAAKPGPDSPPPARIGVQHRIVEIAGESIGSMEDVRLAMLDRAPGEQLWIGLELISANGDTERVNTIVELI